MYNFPSGLQQKLKDRAGDQSLRTLSFYQENIDFYSNDYLGFAKSKNIAKNALAILEAYGVMNGSTGSRLISGTHKLHQDVEVFLANFHAAEAGLLYNSGYDANIGLFSAILQKGDVLLFDELIHASVRDGIRLSNATAYKFKHNDLEDLEVKIIRSKQKAKEVYVSVETVYSMDGDTAPLKELVALCEKYHVYLMVDEAHSSGVYGAQGRGLVAELGLEQQIFARVHTFGKAMGCHGAIVIGSKELRNYLINFSRSFIYTTAVPLHAVATIMAAYQELQHTKAILQLQQLVVYFKKQLASHQLLDSFILSNSAIHCCLIPGNKEVKQVAQAFQDKGIQVKAVLSPTVPKGKERLRFCIHAFNTKAQIDAIVLLLITNMNP